MQLFHLIDTEASEALIKEVRTARQSQEQLTDVLLCAEERAARQGEHHLQHPSPVAGPASGR